MIQGVNDQKVYSKPSRKPSLKRQQGKLASFAGFSERQSFSPSDIFSRSNPYRNSAFAPITANPFIYPVNPARILRHPRFGASAPPPPLPYGAEVIDDKVRFRTYVANAKEVKLLTERPLTREEKKIFKDFHKVRQELSSREAQKQVVEEKQWNVYNFFRKNEHSTDPRMQKYLKVLGDRCEKAWRLIRNKDEENPITEKLQSEVNRLQGEIFRINSERITGTIPMEKESDGVSFSVELPKERFGPGTLYKYRIVRDNNEEVDVPDLWGRDFPEGIKGATKVIDRADSAWDPEGLKFWEEPLDPRGLSIYQMHIGTFFPRDNFESLTDKELKKMIGEGLDYIKDLGFTAVQPVPITQCNGDWNCGYDGVLPFSVANYYGGPRFLKLFSDECNKRKLALILDLNWNHFGPEGNILKTIDPSLNGSSTGWGDGLNFGNLHALLFFRENFLHWFREYHIKGLRLDMVDLLAKQGFNAVQQTISDLYKLYPGPEDEPDKVRIVITGESHEGQNFITMPPQKGGIGCITALFIGLYHEIRGVLTGQSHMDAPTDIKSFVHDIWRGYFISPERCRPRLRNGIIPLKGTQDEEWNNSGSLHELVNSVSKSNFLISFNSLLPYIPFNWMGSEHGKEGFEFFADNEELDTLVHLFRDKWFSPQEGLPTDYYRVENSRRLPKEMCNEKMLHLQRTVNRLRKEVPALWQGDRFHPADPVNSDDPMDPNGRQRLLFLPTEPYRGDDAEGWQYFNDYKCHLEGSDVVAVLRKGYPEKASKYDAFGLFKGKDINYQDEVFILANFRDKNYTNSENGQYRIKFPPGQWVEILNTSEEEFGGPGGISNKNRQIPEGAQEINLPGGAHVLVFRKIDPDWYNSN